MRKERNVVTNNTHSLETRGADCTFSCFTPPIKAKTMPRALASDVMKRVVSHWCKVPKWNLFFIMMTISSFSYGWFDHYLVTRRALEPLSIQQTVPYIPIEK